MVQDFRYRAALGGVLVARMMKRCPKCNKPLKFRFEGGRDNPENIGRRFGADVLKLMCDTCGKFLCADRDGSIPYQTRGNKNLVGLYVKVRSDQSERLQEEPNQSAAVRDALDDYFGG